MERIDNLHFLNRKLSWQIKEDSKSNYLNSLQKENVDSNSFPQISSKDIWKKDEEKDEIIHNLQNKLHTFQKYVAFEKHKNSELEQDLADIKSKFKEHLETTISLQEYLNLKEDFKKIKLREQEILLELLESQDENIKLTKNCSKYQEIQNELQQIQNENENMISNTTQLNNTITNQILKINELSSELSIKCTLEGNLKFQLEKKNELIFNLKSSLKQMKFLNETLNLENRKLIDSKLELENYSKKKEENVKNLESYISILEDKIKYLSVKYADSFYNLEQSNYKYQKLIDSFENSNIIIQEPEFPFHEFIILISGRQVNIY